MQVFCFCGFFTDQIFSLCNGNFETYIYLKEQRRDTSALALPSLLPLFVSMEMSPALFRCCGLWPCGRSCGVWPSLCFLWGLRPSGFIRFNPTILCTSSHLLYYSITYLCLTSQRYCWSGKRHWLNVDDDGGCINWSHSICFLLFFCFGLDGLSVFLPKH